MNVGVLYSRIREDEKLLLGELRERDHEVTKIDVRRETFDLSDPPDSFEDVDVLVDRCLATSRSRYITQFANRYEIPIVNDAATARICADKVETSLALDGAGVPTPTTRVAFTSDEALDAAAELGYPCVVKPVVGSWGRLMAKLDSPNTAEAVFEHKEVLGHYEHKVFYLQEFVDKPGRDIRVLAADGDVVAAMVRSSDHWLTNAAKGAETATFEVSDEVRELVADASSAVGGGLLGIDLMERTDGDEVTGYTVHEINHTVEFKALDGVSDEDVPARVVDYLETVGEGNE
ncbi:lysine biosynthesis protein LysX [Halococcoides cellulosivorans]|uniref:Lysine biosynthesis protein LysX n=1 Tax=Halococcoides cellulosivorans TaxID=1679096 RepID=A0A2R4WY77_9EURY|nr:lysine biosynthesis protein LysX [Halococcoides cellulosivorans]AWB26488.1 lysine biosynthesis protein LysX [Halococcoides cellulosivorans]